MILKDAERMKVRDKAKWFSSVSSFDETLIALAGEIVEDVYGGILVALPTEDVPGVRLAKETIAEYRPGRKLTVLYLEGIHCGMVVAEGLRIALERVGYENLTGSVINSALRSVKDLENYIAGDRSP